MNHLNMTLWQVIDALALQIPFSQQKVEAVLLTQVFEVDNTPNNLLHLFKSSPVELAEGVIISTIDLRIKRFGVDSGILGLDIGGTCITLKQLKTRYEYLKIIDAPRGGSLEEETIYAQNMPWGLVTFGFKERNPKCLASVGL